MPMFLPRTVDAVIKPLKTALTGLAAVATHQDAVAEKAGTRLSNAEASFNETKIIETRAIESAGIEATRARNLVIKIEGLLD